MAVNFSKNQDEIISAWREVVDTTQVEKWALFGYEGATNVIRLMSTGSKGLEELVDEFNCSLIQYAFCRVKDDSTGLNKLVLINWQGESAPLSRKGLCASHVGDVANYFKGCVQTITIRNDDEATKEYLMEQIMKTSASKINLSRQHFKQDDATIPYEQSSVKNSSSSDNKIDIASDLAANRKSFWQRQEEEEKERLAEEKRKAAEKQAQFERERKKREESDALKLAQAIEQRDRLIDATKQADRKASVNNSASSSTGSSSQPSSILSSGPNVDDGDDESRVGRRSELIRLERNQETQSLIAKGLIKNKRAIFEQQANQTQKQQPTTLARRSSGAMVAQRLNAFKSLDVSANSSVGMTSEQIGSPSTKSLVNQLANGISKGINLSGDDSMNSQQSPSPIVRKVETVKLTKEEDPSPANLDHHNGAKLVDNHKNSVPQNEIPETITTANEEIIENIPSPKKNVEAAVRKSTPIQDVNGNSKQSDPANSAAEVNSSANSDTELISQDEFQLSNGKHSEAIALFDYEAADNTEISFDPDDRIGSIQKVDPGWWQGKVMSGRFKGQIGLFPSNYVKEL